MFRNILKLEESRGFNDTAVAGGLDRFLERWSVEIASRAGKNGNSSVLLTGAYADMTAQARTGWAARWRELLDDAPPSGDGALPPEVSAEVSAAPSETPSDAERGPRKSPAHTFRPPPGNLTVDSPVDRLRGVDTKSSARLERLGVVSVRDLLYLFPSRHEDYSKITPIADVTPGEECTVVGSVWEAREVAQGPMGRRKDTEAVLGDETGNIRVIWFGQRYLARSLKPGSKLAVSGKASVFRGQLVFESPEYEPVQPDQPGTHTGRLVPIYPLTEGITGRNMRRLTWQALQQWLGGLEETLPPEMLKRVKLIPLLEAVFQAHYPDDAVAWSVARTRLAFDELLSLQLAVLSRRREQQHEVKGVPVVPPSGVIGGFLDNLPFPLTGAQRRCVKEIAGDLKRGTPPMNRLLQGEVGSGKTVVALAAMLSAVASGYQAAMMAPTELLAEQHFQSVAQLLGGLPRPVQSDHLLTVYLEDMDPPVCIGLLTGSTRAAPRRELTKMAADGTLDLLIGTHALIQEGVSLPKLALAVADEQHRFGVLQRSALRERGDHNPHTLIMSATPIPRTLSLTLYGDLDISTIDEMPAGRHRVATRWIEPERREAAYGFVRNQVGEGRQAFVVCPLVDESVSIEAKAATEEYQRLSNQVFPDLRVGLLHGRMPAKEKDRVMRRFKDGELDVLVSTPVVEVGIDVANATVMLIEAADRFGLAQLHQFRGRVGRGEHRSYCLLLSDTQSETAKERLSALERIHDGFELAEVDLELRGPGDFFGTRQSGLPELRMAHLTDRPLLDLAREEASRLMKEDPELQAPEHTALSAQVARFFHRANADTA